MSDEAKEILMSSMPPLVPAWAEVPSHPGFEDIEQMMKHLDNKLRMPRDGEIQELADAWDKFKVEPTSKNLAKVMEEATDVMCMTKTIIEALARLPMAAKDSQRLARVLVNTKNRLRCYNLPIEEEESGR